MTALSEVVLYSLEADLHGDGWFLPSPGLTAGGRRIQHTASRTVPVGENERGMACRCHRVTEECPIEPGPWEQVKGGEWWHVMPPCKVEG